MTIDPNISSASAIGALGQTGGASAGVGPVDQVRALASQIVGQIAGNFGLLPISAPGQGDVYGLRALADQISASFGGSAADAGALTRAVEDFASAVATDMAAYDDGRTLDLADSAIGASTLGSASDIAGIIDGLDQARVALEGARPA
jgi:hypothetical protein